MLHATRTALMCTTLLATLAFTAGPGSSTARADDAEVEEMCFYTHGEDVGVHHGIHGFEPRAWVGGTLHGDTHRYWLKFDLSGLPSDVDTIESATLHLTAGSKSKLNLGVALGEDTWDAATLDWVSQPGFTPATNAVDYGFLKGSSHTWEVGTHVAFDLASGDDTLSLMLMQVNEGDRTGNVWFYTDTLAGTNDARRPTLCIRYTRKSTDTPPEITVGDELVLSKPKHDMRRFDLSDLATAEDAEDGTLDLQTAGRILSIVNSEAGDAKGSGDGHTSGDARIINDASFEVCAERAGGGSGRTYTVTFCVTDSSGNEVEAQATLHVPHDNRKKK